MAVTESVKIVFEVDDKALVSTVAQLQAVGKVSQEDAAKFNQLSAASKAAGASLDGASKGAKQFAEANKEVAKSTAEVAKSAGELKDVGSSLDAAGQAAGAAGEGFVSLRDRLREAKLEVQQLGEQFNNSGPEFEAAVARAGELSDEFDDLNRQVRLSNPEGKIQAFQNLGQGILGAFQTATGALQAFGVENEAVQEIAQRFQGALNIAQGVQSIVGLKEAYQDVKVVLGLTTAAQTTLTTATTAGSAATTGAAGAMRGFAAALASTGIGAIVVAIGALIGAFILLKNNEEDAIDITKQYKDSQDRLKASIDSLAESELNLAVAQGKITKEQADIIRQRGEEAEATKKITEEQDKLRIAIETNEKALSNPLAPALLLWKTDDARNELQKLKDAYRNNEQTITNIRAEGTKKRNILEQQERQDIIDGLRQQIDDAKAALEKQRQDAIAAGEKRKQDKIKAIQDEIALLEEQQRGALIGVEDELQRIAIVDSFRTKIQEKQIEKAKLAGESIALLDEKFANDSKQSFEDLFAVVEAARDKDVADADKAAADKLAAEKKLLEDKKSLLQQEEQLALLQNQVAATSAEDLAEKNFNTQKEFLEKRIELEKAGSNEQKLLLAQLDLLYKEYEQGKTDEAKKQEEERAELRQKQTEQAFELANTTTDLLVEANQRQYDEELASLENARERGAITEEQYEAKVKKIKQKAAEDQKKAQVFQATMSAAQAILSAAAGVYLTPGARIQAIAFASIIGALNLAKILATPIPRFKQGTLAVPGQDTGDDSVMAMLRPGEAVIPTEMNREYAKTIKAIYTRKVSAKDLNEFVESRSRMTVVKDEPVFNFNPVTLDALFKRDIRVSQMSSALQRSSGGTMPTINVKADVDTYALSKAMAKNKTMEIGNPEQVAKALATELNKSNNLRRQ